MRHVAERAAVVGQHDADLLGDGFDKGREERHRCPAVRPFVQLGERELRGSVDRDEEVEPAFLGGQLGDVGVEEADRIGLEAGLPGYVALDLGQSADAVALETAVQAGARQMRDCGLQRVEAVVEGQECVLAERDAEGFLSRTWSDEEQVNIGICEDVTTVELAQLIARIVGFDGWFVFDPSNLNGTPRKLLDISKLTALGRPYRTYRETGIRQTYCWYLQAKAKRSRSVRVRIA